MLPLNLSKVSSNFKPSKLAQPSYACYKLSLANIRKCQLIMSETLWQGTLKGDHYTVDLLFDWLGIRLICMTTDNCCFYLQNRPIQTSQTGGQQYSDTSPFSIPWFW
jgi:hypothetical protein